MKTKLVLAACAFAGFVAFATHAASPEVISFNAGFHVNECAAREGRPCMEMVSMRRVSIVLDNCTTFDNTTECTGSWAKTDSRGGIPFSGSIQVTKYTQADSAGNTATSYNLVATVRSPANGVVPTVVSMRLGNGGVVSDEVTFNGPTVASEDEKTDFMPTLSVGPVPQERL